MKSYVRHVAAHRNRLQRSCNSLYGIAAGLVADRSLNDLEIGFLRDWLEANDEISTSWPGDVLLARVRAVLEDGVVTEEERRHLVKTLDELLGQGAEDDGGMADGVSAVVQGVFDHIDDFDLIFADRRFCLTGDFMYGPREKVMAEIVGRGGLVQQGVTKKLNYLVVGVLGSDEWKHGSFGTKIKRAMEIKREGLSLQIVREDVWSSCVFAQSR